MHPILPTCIALALVLVASPAAAQAGAAPGPDPEPRRFDVAGLVGWFGEHRVAETSDYYDDWNNRWLGAASVGWYWTPHLKTEVEVGLTSEGESWSSRVAGLHQPDGYPIYVHEQRFHRDVTVAVLQQWQFFDNAWVHPFVSAGLSVDRERTRREQQGSYWPGEEPGSPGPLPAVTRVRALALLGTGLKAYLSERAFFRADVHLAIGEDGPAQVRLRTGVGVDF